MIKRSIAGLMLLAMLGGCTNGDVDWDKVGTGVLAAGALVLVVGAAVVAAQPAYAPSTTTTCNSWGNTTTCRSY